LNDIDRRVTSLDNNSYREPVKPARVVMQPSRIVRQPSRAVYTGKIYDHDAANNQKIVKRGFFIPAGCFIYNEYAKKLEQRIASWGLPIYRKKIISKEHYFNCLFVGPTLSRVTAERNLQILQDGSVSKAVAVMAYK
jgi:hypothetical protein